MYACMHTEQLYLIFGLFSPSGVYDQLPKCTCFPLPPLPSKTPSFLPLTHAELLC